MLVRSGLLEAIADVSLRFARQVKLPTYGSLPRGPNLRRVFDTVLDRLMMRKYKEVVEEKEGIKEIQVEVLEGWELLVKKGGNTKRYRDALLKLECAYLVEGEIAEFGRQHGVCSLALTDYVSCFLDKRLRSGDGGDPYFSLEENKSEDDEDGEDGSSDEDGEDESSDEDGITVDKEGKGVPLYDRESY